MNQIVGKSLNDGDRSILASIRRGELTRKLLKAAKPAKRCTLPPPALVCDDDESMTSDAARVLGPYANGKKWRLVVREGEGRRSLICDTLEEAESIRSTILNAFLTRSSRTIGEAVEEFLTYKRKRGCVERTLRTARDKLLPFLPADMALSSMTPQKAESLYEAQTEKFAAATHHANLRNTKEFFKWCLKQKYILENPLADIQPLGKAKKGKPQLRQDEAKRLSDYLVERASAGEALPLALLVQLLLGLRSGEVLSLRKRDLDRGGSRVVVEGTKNDNAKRTVELKDAPIVMELLARRVATMEPDALIFPQAGNNRPVSTTSLHKALRRFCKRAGVPTVCPPLRGLNATLAVEAGATCALVARALGHSSDVVTKRHYIAPAALDSVRSSRVAMALLGTPDLDSVISTLRNLLPEQLDTVCAAVGYRR